MWEAVFFVSGQSLHFVVFLDACIQIGRTTAIDEMPITIIALFAGFGTSCHHIPYGIHGFLYQASLVYNTQGLTRRKHCEQKKMQKIRMYITLSKIFPNPKQLNNCKFQKHPELTSGRENEGRRPFFFVCLSSGVVLFWSESPKKKNSFRHYTKKQLRPGTLRA